MSRDPYRPDQGRPPIKNLAKACLRVHPTDPAQALHLAVRITRWRNIANLEVWPFPDEVLPEQVIAERDRSLRNYAAAA